MTNTYRRVATFAGDTAGKRSYLFLGAVGLGGRIFIGKKRKKLACHPTLASPRVLSSPNLEEVIQEHRKALQLAVDFHDLLLHYKAGEDGSKSSGEKDSLTSDIIPPNPDEMPAVTPQTSDNILY
ncbi:hypothetical protein NDU88_009319 [Pleurodeles waltl]|uniref:Uncharacterized protein n=1 Tax=Pleurodeles waltl TaxID=8319 RepID=A0AAV7QR76_PLEWA|nr:hypothetical protein NDU88_009319 [Pleurodeles waltl]